MRIISGIHKGFRFPARNMPHARPTTDRAKEALFNILDQSYYFEDVAVLDLYSGMGSMALEFCSRGCTSITTVDFNKKSVSYIIELVNKLKLSLNVKQAKVLKFLEKETGQYDIIFADPPYNANAEIHELIKRISDGNYLKPGGVFILEHQTMTQVSHPLLVDSRNYGQSTFSFFNFANSNE